MEDLIFLHFALDRRHSDMPTVSCLPLALARLRIFGENCRQTAQILDSQRPRVEAELFAMAQAAHHSEEDSRRMASELVGVAGTKWHILAVTKAFQDVFEKGTYSFYKFRALGRACIGAFLSANAQRGKRFLLFGTLRPCFAQADGTLVHHADAQRLIEEGRDQELARQVDEGEWFHCIGLIVDPLGGGLAASFFHCSMFPKKKLSARLLDFPTAPDDHSAAWGGQHRGYLRSVSAIYEVAAGQQKGIARRRDEVDAEAGPEDLGSTTTPAGRRKSRRLVKVEADP